MVLKEIYPPFMTFYGGLPTWATSYDQAMSLKCHSAPTISLQRVCINARYMSEKLHAFVIGSVYVCLSAFVYV